MRELLRENDFFIRQARVTPAPHSIASRGALYSRHR